jgi:hypothetical protein
LPIDLPTTRRPIGIITLKKRSVSPVAQLFIACAREVAKRSIRQRVELARDVRSARTREL